MNLHCLRLVLPLLLLPGPGRASGDEARARPNLLVIMTDDQGYWDLGATGNPHLQTPGIDRLAREGVRFDRFYVAPVCAPTRAGVMTGRYAFRTGLYNTRFGGDSLDLREVTLPELLKQRGYRTGLFGKWHLGQYHGYQPQQRGFDEFIGFYPGHIEHYEFAGQLVRNGRPIKTRGYVTDLFTDAALEFIGGGGAPAEKSAAPFFCFIAYNAPHEPYLLETSHLHQAKGEATLEKYLKRGLPLREARIYGLIERLDQNVGRLLRHLDEQGLARDTVVLFLSDNGGVSRHWKAGLRGNKGSTFEGGVRSPLFVRWPGNFPAGGAVSAQTSHVDLLPTLCELAGAPLPAARVIDGRSLVPLLRAGKGAEHHRYVYHSWNRLVPDPQANWAISDRRFKLHGDRVAPGAAARPAWSLFDLEADPSETTDLAARHPEKVAALRAEFERWFGEVTQGAVFRPVAIPVGHAGAALVELQPSWAQLHGERTRAVFAAYDWDTVEGWTLPGDAAEWAVDVARAGRYEVTVSYAATGAGRGGVLRLSSGGASTTFAPLPTGAADIFERAVVGELELARGPAHVRAEIAAPAALGGEVLRLNRIWLRRLDDVPAASRGAASPISPR